MEGKEALSQGGIQAVDEERMIGIKQEALTGFIEVLTTSAESLERQINQTRQAAIEAPSRMQSRHDSSRQELSYQVDQLTKRLSEMRRNIEILKTFKIPISEEIVVGSLVQLRGEEGKKDLCFLILPGGSGNVIEVNGKKITVISPEAPLSKRLQGKKPNDSVFTDKGKFHVVAVF